MKVFIKIIHALKRGFPSIDFWKTLLAVLEHEWGDTEIAKQDEVIEGTFKIPLKSVI